MFVGNDGYGHRAILAAAAGLKTDLPIRGMLQHGWTQRALVDLPLPGLRPPRVFGWSQSASRRSERYGLRSAANIGAPFLYLVTDHRVQQRRASKDAKGLLIIPPHSTRLTRTDFDIPKWVSIQADRYSLGEEVSVMLHPADARNTVLVSELHKSGVTVWTNLASMKSQDFLLALIQTLCSHRTIVASNLQTAVFYAAYLGVTIELDIQPQGFVSQEGKFVPDLSRSLVRELGISDGRPWQDVCEAELGLASCREPDELLEILRWSSGCDRIASRVMGAPNALRSLVSRLNAR